MPYPGLPAYIVFVRNQFQVRASAQLDRRGAAKAEVPRNSAGRRSAGRCCLSAVLPTDP